MNKYRVKIAYGDPGKHKSNHQNIEVQAETDATAITLAIAKFKNSGEIIGDRPRFFDILSVL